MHIILFLLLPFIVGGLKWLSIKDNQSRKNVSILLFIYFFSLIIVGSLALYFQNKNTSCLFFAIAPIILLTTLIDWIIYLGKNYKINKKIT